MLYVPPPVSGLRGLSGRFLLFAFELCQHIERLPQTADTENAQRPRTFREGGKCLLRYDAHFETHAPCFLYALDDVRYIADFARKPDFADGEQRIRAIYLCPDCFKKTKLSILLACMDETEVSA